VADRASYPDLPELVVRVYPEVPLWTPEAALAYAEAAGPNEGVHHEDLSPRPGERSARFTRDLGAGSDCPWCVLGCCWQRVAVLRGGCEAVEHGRRPFVGAGVSLWLA